MGENLNKIKINKREKEKSEIAPKFILKKEQK